MDNLNKEFDKIFSKGLNDPDPTPPSPKDWEELSRRLDQHHHKGFNWLWLMAPLLLGLIGWLGNYIISLESRLTSIGQNVETNHQQFIKYDTIVHKHIQYDTIYRTIVINKNIFVNNNTGLSIFNNQNPAQPPSIDTDSKPQKELNQSDNGAIEKDGENEEIFIPKENIFDSNVENHQNISEKSIEKASKETEIPNENNGIANNILLNPKDEDSPKDKIKINRNAVDSSQGSPIIKSSSINNQFSTQEDIVQSKKSFFEKIEEVIKNKVLDNEPVIFRLGISAGYGRPIGIGNRSISNSFVGHLHGEILFGRNWAIVPSIGYVSYDSKQEDKFDRRLNVPDPISPGDNFSFKYVEGYYKYLLPSLSLRYRINSEARWSGYTGVGIAANIFRTSRFEYEYLENITAIEEKYYLEYKIPNKYSILKLQVGTIFNLNTRLALFGDLDTYLDLGARPRHFPYISSVMGIKYLMY